jgi:hypothetical protein
MDVLIPQANIYLKKKRKPDKKQQHVEAIVGCAVRSLVPQLHARGLCRRAHGIKVQLSQPN